MFKKTLLTLALATSLFACKDDDEKECTPPALSKHLVSSWKANLKSGALALGPYTFAFTEAGVIQGPIDALLKLHLPNLTVDETVRYAVKDEKTIEVLATSQGQPLPPVLLNVTESKCEKVTLSFDAYTLSLEK